MRRLTEIAKLALSIIGFLISASSFAQEKDSTWIGSVSGSVKDTVHNYFLQSATVSIYKMKDGSLVAYTLTNSLGEFLVGKLPTGVPLQMKISYIGYSTYSRLFTAPYFKPESRVAMGEVHLGVGDQSVDSIVVTPPPVRMHGDTLEFSAAAFALDRNAVAEDLLKKLPGVIVWGDGSITVNGRQISKLLVDGKPFFGGDNRVATQDIPKNAIDKVQVYQESINPENPLDSITSINLKLRKGAHTGYFGTFSGGGATDGRYEAIASSSIFTPRDQFSIAGQSNNVNRLLNSMDALLSSSTYKGVGARVEYQPDFSIQGSNRQTSGGLMYTHDFIPEFNQYKQDRFSTNSFLDRTVNNTVYSTQTTTSSGGDSALRQDNAIDSKKNMTDVDLALQYNKRKGNDSLMIRAAFNGLRSNTQTQQQNEVYNPEEEMLSNDHQDDSLVNSMDSLSFQTSYFHRGFSNSETHRLSNWSVMYSMAMQSDKVDRALKAGFTSINDTASDLFFDRKYNNQEKGLSQHLSMQLGDFSSWLFGRSRALSQYVLVLKNDLRFNIQNQNDFVEDRDTLRNIYQRNLYLSKTGNYTILEETPDLRVERIFLNILANRYQKEFDVYGDAAIQSHTEDNSSNHSFQNYAVSYDSFLPDAGVEYSDFEYGEYLNRFDLDFKTSARYPTPELRVPLVDSSAIYNFQEGNILLKPAEKYEIAFRFRHDVYGIKNTFYYGAGLKGGIIRNYFADSVVSDLAGRYAHYAVNLEGNKYIGGNAFVNKAFILGANQLQVNMVSIIEAQTNPGYIGYQVTGTGGFTHSRIFTNSDTVSVYYTYRDLIAVNLSGNISFYRSKQEGFSDFVFNSTQMLTRFGVGLNVTKRFLLTTNISYNRSVYSQSPPIDYSIWNASASYRFLKGNNLELKVSALDLLNQNKGIISNGGNATFTYGTVNMLHQYFMATISYFPRKFGKKASAK